jgi:hypothetical protein
MKTHVAQWESEGIAHIRGALDLAEVSQLLDALEPLIDGVRSGSLKGASIPSEGNHTVRIENAIEFTDALDPLIDHPRILPLLVKFLSPHLALLGSEIYARYESEQEILEFHMDGGPSLWRVVLDPRSICLSLKVQFFLTDVDRPDSGNFMYVPGSHRLRPHSVSGDELVLPTEIIQTRATQILAKRGDAVVFPWSLWHAVAPNQSGRIRKSVILRFGQLWCRPNDRWNVAEQTLARMTPRRRRLCGDLGEDASPVAWYFPPEQESIILGG